jgi:hypothetical protein
VKQREEMLGNVVKVLAALVLLAGTSVLAFAAFPAGLWVGWRVASGGWNLPQLDGDPVSVARIVVGILVGGAVFRFGLSLRRHLIAGFHSARDEPS